MPTATLSAIRDRVMPMFEITVTEYESRCPAGYPNIIDSAEQGSIGIELDPSFALYFMTDGSDIVAEVYRRNSRTDARSSASQMRHGGAPLSDRRLVDETVSDQTLRNLVAELKSHFNQQPNLIHIVDS